MGSEEMTLKEVARFEAAGDTRVVRAGKTASGDLAVEEVVAGPSCAIAYGESSHTMRVSFSSEVQGKVCRAIEAPIGTDPLEAVRAFLGDEDNALLDLMDACDQRGIPYAFMGMGDASGLQYRPAE